jgi:peptide-methionine (S)-S-oxide reductase
MRKLHLIYLVAILLISVVSKNVLSQNKVQKMNKINTMKATFGGGCFWCTEAIFSQLKGVSKVTSGYSGGHVSNPKYEEVCKGSTGHAECIQIEFDPDKINYSELLEIFWMTHDPTTLNRQGADVGTQYRSVIFYHSEEQKKTAISIKEKLIKENIWKDPIVTQIAKYEKFYAAEDYHQNYYPNNKNQGYCRIVITPKFEKFKKVFSDKIINP